MYYIVASYLIILQWSLKISSSEYSREAIASHPENLSTECSCDTIARTIVTIVCETHPHQCTTSFLYSFRKQSSGEVDTTARQDTLPTPTRLYLSSGQARQQPPLPPSTTPSGEFYKSYPKRSSSSSMKSMSSLLTAWEEMMFLKKLG